MNNPRTIYSIYHNFYDDIILRFFWIFLVVFIFLFLFGIHADIFAASSEDPFPENRWPIREKWLSTSLLDSAILNLNTAYAALNPLKTDSIKWEYKIYKDASHMEFLYNDSGWYNGQKDLQTERKNVIYILERIKDIHNAYKYIENEEWSLAISSLESFRDNHKFEKDYYPDEYKGIDPGLNKGYRRVFWTGGTVTILDLFPNQTDPSGYPTHVKYWNQTPPPEYPGPKSHWKTVGDAIGDYKVSASDFRSNNMRLLLAECLTNLGMYYKAEQKYHSIMGGYFGDPDRKYDPNLATHDDIEQRTIENQELPTDGIELTNIEKKYVAIQRAFNFLAWGDMLFKRSYRQTGKDKKNSINNAKKKYEAALALFPNSNIAKEIDQKITSLENLEKQTKNLLTSNKGTTPTYNMPSGLLDQIDIPTVDISKSTFQSTATGQNKSTPEVSGSTIQSSTTSSENPLIVEIVSNAKMQLLKISRDLNYLGYSSDYVPVQRYKFLYSRADEYADMAVQTELKYIQFKKTAEDEEYQSRLLEQNLQITAYQEQIADIKWQIADEKVDQINGNIDQIDDRIESMSSIDIWSTLGSVFGMIGGFAASAFTGGTSMAVAVSTISYISSVNGFISQDIKKQNDIESLWYQRSAACSERAIAEREGLIADIEGNIANMQGVYINRNVDYLGNKEFNTELYYGMAKALKRINSIYLDAGIQMGYLAERALAFEIGNPNLQFMQLDYERSDLKRLMAGDFLKQDLLMMEYNRVLALKQSNNIKHIISLKQNYPLEFYNFINTGKLDFVTSIYEFDKVYPGTYLRRLKRVEVIIQGLVGQEGFKGSLTNYGSFILRTKEKSLTSKRLIPTSERLENAYQRMKEKGFSTLSVQGVDVYQLPSTRLVLSNYDIREDGIVFSGKKEVRELFEGYGVSGIWSLELPKNINDVDFRTISDIQLVMYFDAYYNEELNRKIGGYYDTSNNKWVKGLVEKYENELSGDKDLDRIAMFSLRQHFPDEFFSLSGGKVGIQLIDNDFPLYMDKKWIKKIMICAVDENGSGLSGLNINLEKPNGKISWSGLTNSDGYVIDAIGYMDPSDDTALDPVKKNKSDSLYVSVTGHWNIKMKDISKIEDIDDILIFFMYAYKEKKADFNNL